MLFIKNATVYTMAGPPLPGATIGIDGGKIAVVGQVEIPTDSEVIDASGKIVMPGLIEAHCHLGIAEEIYRYEGDDINEVTDPLTPHLRAIDAINPADVGFLDARQGGVTTVFTGPGSANVVGGEGVILKTAGTVVDRMILKAPAGLKVAFGENPKFAYKQQKKMPSTRMGTAALLRQLLNEARNYLQRQQAYRNNPDKFPDCDLRLEAATRVLRREIPLRAHAHRADDMMTAIRIAAEFEVDLVLEHATEGHLIAGELATRGVPAVVGPSLSNRSKVELKEKTFSTPAVLAAQGVKVAIMTDHPVVPIEYLSLCAALAHKEGLTEIQALGAITIDAARILGVADRIGSIEPGKDADLIILNGPLFNLMTRVETVFINGQIVYRSPNR